MEEFCYVVVIDVFLLEDENYESNLCVVNDSIVMCIKQRTNGVVHLLASTASKMSILSREKSAGSPNSIIPC